MTRSANHLGWRTHAVADATAVEKLPDTGLDPTVHLGSLGLIGLTTHGARTDGGHLTEGDTVFTSAATDAVGCLAGQIARLLTDTLGFNTAIDYTQGDIASQLRSAAPDGIDVYFDNVGGDHLAAALDALHHHEQWPWTACHPRSPLIISTYSRRLRPAPRPYPTPAHHHAAHYVVW